MMSCPGLNGCFWVLVLYSYVYRTVHRVSSLGTLVRVMGRVLVLVLVIASNYTVLYCTVLYCTVLYRTISS